MKNKRILIISNECLSNSSSNGRTLRNFLIGWEKENLAQFYIKDGNPDYSICSNYYNVTDEQALNSFLLKKKNNKSSNSYRHNDIKNKKIRRSAISMFIRDIVWNSNRWMDSDFNDWINEFNPNIILFQAGDSAFPYILTLRIARKFNIPYIIYNSENYYFKKYDYFRSKGFSKLIYPLYHTYFKSKFKKTIKKASLSIYNSEDLKNDYLNEFNLPSEYVYTATELETKIYPKKNNNPPVISYLGNLGVGRAEVLIEIANAISKIDKNIYLDIYGSIPNEEIKNKIMTNKSVRFNGFISYNKVIDVMRTSDILIHAENFKPFYKEGLKRAFSTKIADYLASGTCFLLYAPEDLTCTKYLRTNKVAHVISDSSFLYQNLLDVIKDNNFRTKYLNNALNIVNKNHDFKKNAKKFQDLILKVIRNSE